MRRVDNPDRVSRDDQERGAISIVVAVLMVALLGFTALVVDVGLLYAERAQIQSGADAAAIAIAQKCAKDPATPDCSASSPIAHNLADSNALDGLTNIQSIALQSPPDLGGKVTVTTGAQEAGGAANTVSLFVADSLGVPTASVGAKATAVWGSPTAGTTPFPLAFSICQVQGWVEGALQKIQSHGSTGTTCPYGPSGQAVAGGYGWIVQEPGACGGSVDIDVDEGGSDTGNDGPSNCDAILNKWATDINAGRDVTVLLPVFNQVTGTGSGAAYNLTSFAAFRVTGWKFSGGTSLPLVFRNTSTFAGTKACTGDCRGIIGKFVKYVSLESGYKLGPLDSHGAAVVRMAG